jgi:hypothetical protein
MVPTAFTHQNSKLHKRKVDLLEPLVPVLNVTYYLVTSYQICLKIGETYAFMIDLKLEIASKKLKTANDQLKHKLGAKIQKL